MQIDGIVNSQEIITSESNLNTNNVTLFSINNASDKTFLPHDESFPKNKFETKHYIEERNKKKHELTNESNMKKFVPLKVQLLQQLNPINILKPVQDKLEKVKETLQLTAPNTVQFWSPDKIWEKIHLSGHNVLTGK